MEDDDAGSAAQRFDDPAVSLRIVADVVEGDVGLRRAAEAAGSGDLDVDPLLERGEQQRAVVGDARARGRQRGVVGDLHARRRSIARSHVSCSATWRPACPHVRASSTWSRSHAQASATAAGRGSQTSPVRRSVTTSSGPAGVGGRDDGLLGEKRLEGHHAEVLVHGRVVDGEAASVEVGQLGLVDAAGERHAPVEALPRRQLLEPSAVGPVAGDHAAQRRVGGERLEHEVDALRAVEPADREHEVAVLVAAIVEVLRRMRHHLGGNVGRAREAVGDVLGGGEDAPRLAEAEAVEPLHLPAERAVGRRLGELAELGAVELVRLPELVQQPDDLVRDGGRSTTGTSSRSPCRSRGRPPRSGRRAARGGPGSARERPGTT